MRATDWLQAFPLQPVTGAVEALIEGWTELAAVPLTHFNATTKEDALTKRLKIYIETQIAPRRGLMGVWAAEDIIGEMDSATGTLTNERRTDIVYGWNDQTQTVKLVFEFKRLGRQKRHQDHYLREQGLMRFVTGIYSRRQDVAAMVGVLLDPYEDVVPPIQKAFDDPALVTALRLRPAATGAPLYQPSQLFTAADFDTEHERAPHLASSHGIIRVSHFFLRFGYPTTTLKAKTLKPPAKR